MFELVLFTSFFLLLSSWRILRWVAIIQQKEYRFDRWWAFIKTAEGKRELALVLPSVSVLSRSGLKRPKRTPRSGLVLLSSTLLLAGLFAGLGWFSFQYSWLGYLGPVVVYLTLPFWILVAAMPSILIALTITQNTLRAAQQKVRATNPLIIAITGSYGKSSTKHLLTHLLEASGPVFATPASHNTRYSVAQSIVNTFDDQPMMVLEYGAYTAGEVSFLCEWFPPDFAVITGLAPQHLELFGSLEAIITAKSELVRAVPAVSRRVGVPQVFYHGADRGAYQIVAAGQEARATMGKPEATTQDATGPGATEVLQHPGLNARGELLFVWRGRTVQTKLVGLHYLDTVQLAVTIALAFGVPELEIAERLESFIPGLNFIQTWQTSTGALVVDDGKTANQTGFSAALDLAAFFTSHGRKVTLLTAGIIDLGPESSGIHQALAAEAASVVERVIYLGEEGADEFKQVFGARFTQHGRNQAPLPTTDEDTVILIEGRVPAWIYQAYQKDGA